MAKVLVVDDEKVIRDFITRLLKLEGIEVVAVEDGYSAIEVAKQEKFDMVFLDMRMPNIDGVETLKELKKVSPDSRYVMMTGYAVDEMIAEAKKEGVNTFIKKPFDIQEIKAELSKIFYKEVVTKTINKVLVVDDEKVIRDFITRLLKLEGIEVVAVEDGYSAIEVAKQEKFDMVFLDMRMPNIDGVETLKELKKVSPDSRYVMMTGYAVDEMIAEAKKEGVNTFIRKPFDIEEIKTVIERR